MTKKIYVFDTSVCLTDANSIKSFGTNDIVIPIKVLDEIDNHKNRQDGVGLNARLIIKELDLLREKGNLREGVRIQKGHGILYVKNYDPEALPKDLELHHPDNQIIATALTEKAINNKRKVFMVSRDINMRVKCDSLGLESQNYEAGDVVENRSDIYTGFKKHLVDDQMIDRLYAGEDVYIEGSEGQFYPNEFIMLVSNSNEKKTALSRFTSHTEKLKRVNNNHRTWDVTPRNKEQCFAMDLLKDKDVPIVSLIGKAGCGKTLLAVAAGLEQTLNDNTYKKIIISRPVQPLGKDIGFLPGTLEEKMLPWLAPIQDNLEYLMGNDKVMITEYAERGLIQVEALTYIRGRSISDAFIIIDEAQNLTRHEIKTILTRVSEGTKIILTGDIEQIDNVYINEISNGLTYVIEKMKEHDLAGHIMMEKGERSKVATLAAKIL